MLSPLCEDEAKATLCIAWADWSLRVCVECLFWGTLGTSLAHVVFLCKPLSCVCCWCKHCVALFNISLNMTLFSQCCLFILCVCVWVNGKMGIQVLFSVSLCPSSITRLPPCHSASFLVSPLCSASAFSAVCLHTSTFHSCSVTRPTSCFYSQNS